MLRNILLAISSLAVLTVLFVAYYSLMGVRSTVATRPAEVQIPPQEPSATQPLRVADTVEIPAGGKIVFRRYDERTGRPTDMFLCQDWQPLPGSANEIRVRGPELAMQLPSGMVAHIAADEGQIAVDRVEQSQMRPQAGWLAGDVRIVVDRETAAERSPARERPEDLITVHMARLDFNLETGELRTAERVTVDSDDFEMAGAGLYLVWNQEENRLDVLTIERGERFVLYAAPGFLAGGALVPEPGVAATAPAERGAEAAGPSGPARAAATGGRDARGTRRRSRPATGYRCVLDGGLKAEQMSGSERVGGLEADRIELLFDVGGGSESLLREGRPAASGPASRPAREDRPRLEVEWHGRLALGPVAGAGPNEPRRRRFTAVGAPVVMTRKEGQVRCGEVRFHDETQRVWLYPVAGGTVEFGMGEKLAATAESVYIDRGSRLVKLVGDVELRSRGGPAGRTSSIRCSYWGELHLVAGATPPAGGEIMNADQLESATFVGDVQVLLGRASLTAHRLDVSFHPDEGERGLEALLDRAWATGDVKLKSGDGQLETVNLEMAFDVAADGDLYPQRMAATGAAVMTRGPATLAGARIVAHMAPPAADAPPGGPAFFIRDLELTGAAELLDPEEKRAARGERIVALFAEGNRLATATVEGTADVPAMVHARPYTVWGRQVEMDYNAWTLDVEGPSRLALKARRSLQGRERGQALPIQVRSDERLHVDLKGNSVRMEGRVRATSQGEQLEADVLTLLLEDTREPQSAPADSQWRGWWRQLRGLVGGRPERRDELLTVETGTDTLSTGKEPVRLVAENALVTSETFEAGAPQPVMHASISAPRLEADLPGRQIVTVGRTQLLMTDRRGLGESEAARETIGLPSALLSRGPSQTAMQCDGRMVYALGEDGPQRRDTVVFEDEVVFVHRAGREMVNLAEMLPEAVARPELLESLPSRAASLECARLTCWFMAEGEAGRPVADPLGGGLTSSPMRLIALTAMGNVYLRDREDTQIREVHAATVEFDREHGRIEVAGTPAAGARIYIQDTATGRFDPHTGQRVVINMKDGTVRSERIEGELRRP